MPATQNPLSARRAAAAKYKPKEIKLLLVAEAPTCDTERYFYFEEVDRHDWLFRYVYEGVTGKKPTRERKAAHLAELREAGLFVIDLHEENAEQPSASVLAPLIPELIRRCRTLKPAHIAFIKSIVYDVAFEPLKAAGLPVIDQRLPFPASGQQRKFLEGFAEALKASGV